MQRNPELIQKAAGLIDQAAEAAQLQKDQMIATNKALEAQAIELQAKAHKAMADVEKAQAESERLIYETKEKLDLMFAQRLETESRTALNAAKAQTESVNNHVSVAQAINELTSPKETTDAGNTS